LVSLLIYQRIKREKLAKFQKELIKNQWGKGPRVKAAFEYRDFLHKFLQKYEETDFIIDDITWQDLNMDTVFNKIDHTMSLPGRQYLYYILRRPYFQEDILWKRKNTINLLEENKNVSQEIQYPLFLLGKEENKSIYEYFEEGVKVDT